MAWGGIERANSYFKRDPGYIMKSAKYVIKTIFSTKKKFYFTMCIYIFLRNIFKFQEKRFINNYLITNY